MSIEMCSRCNGGDIYAPNCPMCSGSGFINTSVTPATLPVPSHKVAGRHIPAGQEKAPHRIKIFKVSRTPKEKMHEDQEKRQRQKDSQRRLSQANGTFNRRNRYPETSADPAKKRQLERSNTAVKTHNTPKVKNTQPHPRSREQKSAASVANNQMEQQLASLLGSSTQKQTLYQENKASMTPQIPEVPRPKTKKTLQKEHRVNTSPDPKSNKSECYDTQYYCRKKNVMRVVNGHLEKPEKTLHLPLSTSNYASLPSRGGSRKGHLGDDQIEQIDDSVTAPFEVSSYEEDGGRYYGTHFREADGKFGSLPLYDDYDN